MSDEAPSAPSVPDSLGHCANCGEPLLGKYCYACGQPVKGLIRHLSGVMADFLDSVLDFDSRTVRTLWPLYVRPGFLSCEYFEGRRVRYVTPLRLFFFLIIVAFFAIQLALNLSGLGEAMRFGDASRMESIQSAQTQQEVEQRVDNALAGMHSAKEAPGVPAAAIEAMKRTEQKIRTIGEHRIAYLKRAEAARQAGKPVPPDPAAEEKAPSLSFGDHGKWDPRTNPLKVAWLPDAGNRKLNEIIGHMRDNLVQARKNPGPLIGGLFSVLPQTLLVMLPLFALLLKIFYIFKRRLYMEHLIVALHSHAFIALSLLLLALVAIIGHWLPGSGPVATALGWLTAAIWIWLPLYLLLMQKRVYGQGWILTLLKYFTFAICYSVLLSLGLTVAAVISLAVT